MKKVQKNFKTLKKSEKALDSFKFEKIRLYIQLKTSSEILKSHFELKISKKFKQIRCDISTSNQDSET